MAALRVGVVSYLNARPLTAGLEGSTSLELCRMEPSRVAQALLMGEVDIGLVPSVTLLSDEELTYLPGLCIGADGAVDSVFLFENTSRSTGGPARVILDPASRTSQELTRIYLEEFMDLPSASLAYSERDPLSALADGDGDFVLMIGDRALNPDLPGGWRRIDLASEWKKATGLPFVFAVWGLSKRTLREHPELPTVFAESLSMGMTHLEQVVAQYASRHEVDVVQATHYLRDRIVHTMGAREEEGLRAFFERVRRRREE